jgi:hypothetical protein
VVPTLPVKVVALVVVAVLSQLDLMAAALEVLVIVPVTTNKVALELAAAEAGVHQVVLVLEPVALEEETQLH